MNRYIRYALVLWHLSLLQSIPCAGQERGFFHLYERPERQFIAFGAIEAIDGCFIVAMNDHLGAAEIALLSKEGELMKNIQINDDGNRSGITELFNDPEQEGLIYAFGGIYNPVKQQWRPYILHFDESLNILSRKVVELPDKYKSFFTDNVVLTKNNKFLYAVSLDKDNDYHRLYMLISLDGMLESFADIDTDASSSIWVDAICDSPDDGIYYEYRESYDDSGNMVRRLYSFDDGFVFYPINEYYQNNTWIGDTLYSIYYNGIANSTMMPLNISTLLITDRLTETWCAPNGAVLSTDYSTVLFSTDLEGNIRDQLIVGSHNDTMDYPFNLNAIAIVDGCNAQEKCVYHGCYGYFFPLRPANITLTKTDTRLTPLWRRAYSKQGKFLQATHISATNDGGCLIVGGAEEDMHFDWFALKVNPEGMVDSNEIIVEHQIIIYPNPVGEELRLHCSPDVTLKQVELYDLEGRRVLSQRAGLEQIDMGNIPAGLYTLRVTIDDGTCFTDKVIKQ